MKTRTCRNRSHGSRSAKPLVLYPPKNRALLPRFRIFGCLIYIFDIIAVFTHIPSCKYCVIIISPFVYIVFETSMQGSCAR